jgi:hypothetical protein
MTRPISVARLKANILNSSNKSEMIRILVDTLPYHINKELKEEVKKQLIKRYVMVKELEASLIKFGKMEKNSCTL